MSDKKPIPKDMRPVQKKCPVCGHSSYSASGIHPQCISAQADNLRRQQMRDVQQAETEKQVKLN